MSQNAILFDFDGTIADTVESTFLLAEQLADKYGFPRIPKEELPRLRKTPIKQLLKEYKIPLLKIPFILREGRKLQSKFIHTMKPCKDMDMLLQEITKIPTKRIVVTSNSVENVQTFITQHNLPHFDDIHSESSIFGKAKVINKVIKKFGLEKENVLYIGDEMRDIDASHEVGIKVASVTWGFNDKELLQECNPDFLVDTPKDLLKVIQDFVDR